MFSASKKKRKQVRYSRKYDLNSILNPKTVKVKPPFTWFTIIATWFYIGLIGIMPGTLASLASYPLYWVVLHKAQNMQEVVKCFYALAITTAVFGTWAVYKYQKATNTMDHRSVVIDEIFGMLVALAIGFDSAYS